jgi:hypothetical protein
MIGIRSMALPICIKPKIVFNAIPQAPCPRLRADRNQDITVIRDLSLPQSRLPAAKVPQEHGRFSAPHAIISKRFLAPIEGLPGVSV